MSSILPNTSSNYLTSISSFKDFSLSFCRWISSLYFCFSSFNYYLLTLIFFTFSSIFSKYLSFFKILASWIPFLFSSYSAFTSFNFSLNYTKDISFSKPYPIVSVGSYPWVRCLGYLSNSFIYLINSSLFLCSIFHSSFLYSMVSLISYLF